VNIRVFALDYMEQEEVFVTQTDVSPPFASAITLRILHYTEGQIIFAFLRNRREITRY